MENRAKTTSIAVRPVHPTAISLICLFQILTACCIFFACLRVSPFLAIIGTLISTPAIIRTGLASEKHRLMGSKFDLLTRLKYFGTSVLVVLLISFVAVGVFAIVSMAFGLFCVCVALIVGQTDMLSDIAFMGTAGGMIWGAAASIVAVSFCCRHYWMPKLADESA